MEVQQEYFGGEPGGKLGPKRGMAKMCPVVIQRLLSKVLREST
jgi:hypothetical protein